MYVSPNSGPKQKNSGIHTRSQKYSGKQKAGHGSLL